MFVCANRKHTLVTLIDAIIISLGLLVANAVQVCDQARTNQLAGLPPFARPSKAPTALAIPMLVGHPMTMARS